MINLTRKKLTEKSGMGKILGCVIVLVLLIIFLAISEHTRNNMTARSARNGLESAATTISTNNFDEIYRCQREGYFSTYSIGEEGKDDSWTELFESDEKLDEILQNNLGVIKQGNKYIKKTLSGKTDFELSNVDVKIKNPELAPDDDSKNKQTFNVEITAKLSIYPMFKIFGNDEVIDVNIGAKSGYTPKF